jgi:hypothetical protein
MIPDPEEEVITEDGPDRAYKPCRCAGCGLVALCEPFCDFYTLAFRPDDRRLYCEACLMSEAQKDGAI